MEGTEFMNMREVASRLGVSISRAYALAQEGKLPVTRRGRRLVIPAGAWARWIARQENEALASAVRRNEMEPPPDVSTVPQIAPPSVDWRIPSMAAI